MLPSKIDLENDIIVELTMAISGGNQEYVIECLSQSRNFKGENALNVRRSLLGTSEYSIDELSYIIEVSGLKWDDEFLVAASECGRSDIIIHILECGYQLSSNSAYKICMIAIEKNDISLIERILSTGIMTDSRFLDAVAKTGNSTLFHIICSFNFNPKSSTIDSAIEGRSSDIINNVLNLVDPTQIQVEKLIRSGYYFILKHLIKFPSLSYNVVNAIVQSNDNNLINYILSIDDIKTKYNVMKVTIDTPLIDRINLTNEFVTEAIIDGNSECLLYLLNEGMEITLENMYKIIDNDEWKLFLIIGKLPNEDIERAVMTYAIREVSLDSILALIKIGAKFTDDDYKFSYESLHIEDIYYLISEGLDEKKFNLTPDDSNTLVKRLNNIANNPFSSSDMYHMNNMNDDDIEVTVEILSMVLKDENEFVKMLFTCCKLKSYDVLKLIMNAPIANRCISRIRLYAEKMGPEYVTMSRMLQGLLMANQS